MKTENLMIGNWVNNRSTSSIIRVTAIFEDNLSGVYGSTYIEESDEDNFEGIPLTKEIMYTQTVFKNGIYKNFCDEEYEAWELVGCNDSCRIRVILKEMSKHERYIIEDYSRGHQKNVFTGDFVHQLQNQIFLLLGVKIDIKF